MLGSTTPRKGERYDLDEVQAAYLADSTLSELAVVSPNYDTTSSASWGWFSTAGAAEELAVPPPLPEGTIPTVKIEDFQRYISSVGSSLEQQQESKGVEQHVETAVVDSNDEIAGARLRREASSGLAQAMAEVPSHYFQEGFRLDLDSLGPIESPEMQQSVVEELSLQLDRVETHLTTEIAGRYNSYFEASIYIQQLKDDVQQLTEHVIEKRRGMAAVLRQAEGAAATASALCRRKQNLLAALDLVQAVQQIVHVKSAMENSLAAASYAGLDYISTLDVLEELKESCCREDDVMGLLAVGGLPEYMDSVQAALKEIMVADLVEKMVMDVDGCVDQILCDQKKGSTSITTSTTTVASDGERVADEIDAEALQPIVLSLCKIECFEEALQVLQKEMHSGMSILLAKIAQEYLTASCNVDIEDIPDDLAPGPLAVALNRANSDQYLHLLQLCAAGTQHYVARCEKVVAAVMAALTTVSILSEQLRGQHKQHLLDSLHRVAQVAVTCWSNLLTSWTTVAGLDKLDIVVLGRLLDITDAFAAGVELHLGKSVAVLQGPIQQCCKAALDLMHTSNVAKLSASLQREKWVYAFISQECIDQIMPFGGAPAEVATAAAVAVMIIDSHRFQLVATAQVLISCLQHNLEFSEAFPAFIVDVSQRVVELLRSFNSKTCQLILGAGAMQVSGLKSITVKHLAVACETVRAVLALFPSLTTKFVDLISLPRQTLIAKEFERTKQDMIVHCSEINNKIITIMCERVAPMNNFARLLFSSITTPAAPTEAPPPPSGLALNTMKQVQILADILTSTALPEDRDTIMKQVLNNFVSVMTAAYDDDGDLNAAGLQEQSAVDLKYFLDSINNLPLTDELTEGCTHDMRALQLRKVTNIEAHRKAQELRRQQEKGEEALRRQRQKEEEEELRRKWKQQEAEELQRLQLEKEEKERQRLLLQQEKEKEEARLLLQRQEMELRKKNEEEEEEEQFKQQQQQQLNGVVEEEEEHRQQQVEEEEELPIPVNGVWEEVPLDDDDDNNAEEEIVVSLSGAAAAITTADDDETAP